MNSPLADPDILYKNEHQLLNKVLTIEEIKVFFYVYNRNNDSSIEIQRIFITIQRELNYVRTGMIYSPVP